MHIVGRHDRQRKLLRQQQQAAVDLLLPVQPVPLQFDIKAVFAEDAGKGLRRLARAAEVVPQQPLGDQSRQTGRQRDESLGVRA